MLIMELTADEMVSITDLVWKTLEAELPNFKSKRLEFRKLWGGLVLFAPNFEPVVKVSPDGVHCYWPNVRRILSKHRPLSALLKPSDVPWERLCTGKEAAKLLGYKNQEVFWVIASRDPKLKELKILLPTGAARWKHSELLLWAESRGQEVSESRKRAAATARQAKAEKRVKAKAEEGGK